MKELEHIIRKCDPQAAALPNLTKGSAVPGLYLHIAHSNDKEGTDIPQPFKGHDPNNPNVEAEEKASSLNKNQKILQYRYKNTNTITMILIITTTMKITEVNLEDIHLTEAKIQVNFSEVKFCMVKVNAIKIHTKANIKTIAIKVIITKAIEVYIITYVEIFNRAIIMANLEAEAVVVAEVIIKVTTITNTISIMVMMMSTRLINMAHLVHYALL